MQIFAFLQEHGENARYIAKVENNGSADLIGIRTNDPLGTSPARNCERVTSDAQRYQRLIRASAEDRRHELYVGMDPFQHFRA